MTRPRSASRQMVVVVLEVTRGSDPVAGSLRADGRPARAFTGWLELTEGLTEAFSQPAAASTDVGHSGARP